MPTQLNAIETRIMGCLLEKAVITPDQYPLTQNALTNACNQKSSRDPVMSLSPGEVLNGIRSLQDKHLVRVDENFRNQTEKFTQRLCNTPFSDYQFDPAQYAVICVLLLRGPRTPGEIRANSGRLHTFANNEEVVATLETLIDGENGTLVTQLARTPGRRDAEYMHLFLDTPQALPGTPQALSDTPQALGQPEPQPIAGSSQDQAIPDDGLEARVARLETEVAELRQALSDIMREQED